MIKKDRFRNIKNNKAALAILISLLIVVGGIGVQSVTFTQTNIPGGDSSNNLVTYIYNSNGNYYDLTESDLQSGIWDLNDTGGWIKIPSLITLTSTLEIISDVKYIGVGNTSGFFLADGSDCAMIQNENWDDWTGDPTTNDYDCNITMENLYFNQNDEQQSLYTNVGNYALMYHAIRLFCVRNVTIRNCKFINVVADGVNVNVGSNVHIDNNEFYRVGKTFDTGTATEVTTRGIYFFFCDNISANDNIFKEMHCSAIALEPFGGNKWNKIENFQFCRNFIDDCWNGIWVEGHNKDVGNAVKKGLISDNIISNFTNPYGYKTTNVGQMNAIGVVRFTYDIIITDNIISNGGNKTNDIKGRGIWAIGENITVETNDITTIYGYGIVVNVSSSARGNIIKNTSNYGIYGIIPVAECDLVRVSPDICYNTLVGTRGGIQIKEAVSSTIDINMKSGKCNYNTILACDKTSGEFVDGIYINVYNMSVIGNEIHGGQFGIKLSGSFCDLSNNNIYDSNDFGIKAFRSGGIIQCDFSFNKIRNCVDTGLILYDVTNSSFVGNRISNCQEGLIETTSGDGGCGYNSYLTNRLWSNTISDYTLTGTNNKWGNNSMNFGTFV